MSYIAQIPPLQLPRDNHRWRDVCRVIFWIGFAGLFAWLAIAGWNLRETVWHETRPIRFRGDISNGFAKGLGVVNAAKREAGIDPTLPQDITWLQFFHGYLKTYDLAAADAKVSGGTERYALDYTPLRLLVMSAWVKQIKVAHPNATAWQDDYTPFMLRVNSIFEIAAALILGLLVWDTVRRSHRPPVFMHEIAQEKTKFFRASDRAILAGALAAMIFWFNPSNLLDAHAWPQWDLWLVPFYLLAMWLAVRDRFFWAGVAIAVGAMFKGQILLAAPVLVIWPLFQWRWGQALLVILGFACGLLLCASAWLVPNLEAWAWIACVAPMAAIFATSTRASTLGWSWWLAAVIASGLIVWPWLNDEHVAKIFLPLSFVAVVCVVPTMLPRRAGFGIFTVLLCLGLLLSAHRFDGSWNWFKIGFLWPTHQYRTMTMGFTCNIAWLLQSNQYSIDSVWHSLHLPGLNIILDLTTRHLLLAMYGASLILCGWGAAMHAKRSDPRLLIALAAPWILAFAILTQMHERYLVWAAAILGVGCAVSTGMTLLHGIVIAISSGMIFHDMLYASGNQWWPEMARFLEQNRQGLSYLVLQTALIYLVVAVIPRPRSGMQ